MTLMTSVRVVVLICAAFVPLCVTACGGGGGGGGGGLLPGAIVESSTGPTPLPDGAQPMSQYPSNIVITTPNTSIDSISVVLNLTHERIQDLDVLLVGPTGIAVLLMSDCLGDNAFNSQAISFSHASSTSVPSGTIAPPPTAFEATNYDLVGDSDAFYPTAPAGPYSTDLPDFVGTNPNGTWSLYVYDDTANGTATGALTGWQLWLNTQ